MLFRSGGYGNDAAALAIRNLAQFWVEISGDEDDDPPSEQEGDNDRLLLAGVIDPASPIIKFEESLILGPNANLAEYGFALDPSALTDESGAEFLSEPVGGDAPTQPEQSDRVFVPLVLQ